jgi:hypothetical protein
LDDMNFGKPKISLSAPSMEDIAARIIAAL